MKQTGELEFKIQDYKQHEDQLKNELLHFEEKKKR